MIRKKILLIGDFGVGKTSLIKRYIDNEFSDKYKTTIGVKISKKYVKIGDINCELLIWDIEGATPVKKIPSSYFKGASGAIFVCDVSREETKNDLVEHIKSFLDVNKQAKYVIAYNKTDLLNAQQKEVMASKLSTNEFMTSAKDDYNVSKLFEVLTKEMLA
jgi:small GTP-binding protein